MAKQRKKSRKSITLSKADRITLANHQPEFDADTVQRATRAVITGSVAGEIRQLGSLWKGIYGDFRQCYMVIIKPEAVRKMLKRERKEA